MPAADFPVDIPAIREHFRAMKSKPQEKCSARYDYSTGKMSTGGKKPEAKGPEMGRRVMPGDAHAAMKKSAKY